MSYQKDNQYRVSSFAEFKKYREEISDNICPQLIQIFQECASHELSTNSLITEIENLCQKLQNQNFTVAVVGEFSRGKSTLINALVREQIQPVRTIACSSTITFLKHGLQKRIICHYKNGDEKEISFEEYRVLATLSKEAVRKHRGSGLANVDIDQIIFEHPDLEFCKNGIVLVDSPGLNEHPERSAITQKLLRDCDAVIFLTIALQALSNTERDLIKELTTQLDNGEKNQSAHNLFIVVNQMDALDSEQDKQDVHDLVEEFAYGENPIIIGKNRVHFISAKKVIDSLTDKTENEYSKTFSDFTQSLEDFLASERGAVEIKNYAMKIQQYTTICLTMFEDKCNGVNVKITNFESDKKILIEQIGELSGYGVKIRGRSEKLMNEMLNRVQLELKETWSEWIDGISLWSSLNFKSFAWQSDKNIIWDRKGILEDYLKQFSEDFNKEVEDFANKEIRKIIKIQLELLDEKLKREIQDFIKILEESKENTPRLKPEYKFDYPQKIVFTRNLIDNILDGLTVLLVAYLMLLIVNVLNPVSIVVSLLLGILTRTGFRVFDIKEKIRELVFEECIKQVRKEVIISQLITQIDTVIHKDIFNARLSAIDEMIEETISSCDSLLTKQEKEHNQFMKKWEIEKAFINQKRQELEQVQKELQTIINKSTTL